MFGNLQKLAVCVAVFVLCAPGVVLNVPPLNGSFRGDLLRGYLDVGTVVRTALHGVLFFYVAKQLKVC